MRTGRRSRARFSLPPHLTGSRSRRRAKGRHSQAAAWSLVSLPQAALAEAQLINFVASCQHLKIKISQSSPNFWLLLRPRKQRPHQAFGGTSLGSDQSLQGPAATPHSVLSSSAPNSISRPGCHGHSDWCLASYLPGWGRAGWLWPSLPNPSAVFRALSHRGPWSGSWGSLGWMDPSDYRVPPSPLRCTGHGAVSHWALTAGTRLSSRSFS